MIFNFITQFFKRHVPFVIICPNYCFTPIWQISVKILYIICSANDPFQFALKKFRTNIYYLRRSSLNLFLIIWFFLIVQFLLFLEFPLIVQPSLIVYFLLII